MYYHEAENEDDESYIDFTAPELVVDTGVPAYYYWQSLYYDGTFLYWSQYCDDDYSYLYVIDPESGDVYNAGDFGESMWPVTGLYEMPEAHPEDPGVDPDSIGSDIRAKIIAQSKAHVKAAGFDREAVEKRMAEDSKKFEPKAGKAAEETVIEEEPAEAVNAAETPAVIDEAAAPEEEPAVEAPASAEEEPAEEPADETVEEPADEPSDEPAEADAEEETAEDDASGSLNSVAQTKNGDETEIPELEELKDNAAKAGRGTKADGDEETESVAVEIKDVNATNNGFVTVTYDPAELVFAGTSSELGCKSIHVDEEAGKIFFAYADKETIDANTLLAAIEFGVPCEDAKATVTVTERNTALDLNEESSVSFEGTGHEWDEPVWTWTKNNSEATATFICKKNENHKKEVTAEATAEEGTETTVYTVTVTGPDGKTYTDSKEVSNGILRVAGTDRYLTSFKNADLLKDILKTDKFDAVVVSTGDGFADSLSGAYLANVKKAPILLINAKKAEDVRAYISENLKPDGTVYVLGGEGAVKDSWLEGISQTVKRLAGSSRYETNLIVLEEVGYTGGDILVATGVDYPDSLSGSSLDMPILLVKGKTLTKEQKDFLEGKNLNIYIVGGTGVVTKEMETALKAYGSVAKRFAGSNRYETSGLMAEEFFGDATKAVLTVGNNYPDGLSAGPVAAAMYAPILLVNEGKTTEAAKYTEARRTKGGVVIGGDNLISDKTATTLLHYDTVVVYGEQ